MVSFGIMHETSRQYQVGKVRFAGVWRPYSVFLEWLFRPTTIESEGLEW